MVDLTEKALRVQRDYFCLFILISQGIRVKADFPVLTKREAVLKAFKKGHPKFKVSIPFLNCFHRVSQWNEY